jgi:hypothetical protein
VQALKLVLTSRVLAAVGIQNLLSFGGKFDVVSPAGCVQCNNVFVHFYYFRDRLVKSLISNIYCQNISHLIQREILSLTQNKICIFK